MVQMNDAPREVSLQPLNPFQIDESDKIKKKKFPDDYNGLTEMNAGISCCGCLDIPSAMNCYSFGAVVYIIYYLFYMIFWISTLYGTEGEEGLKDRLPPSTLGKGAAKQYVEAQKEINSDPFTGVIVSSLFLGVFVLSCSALIIWYLWESVVNYDRTIKSRRQAMKAPLVYIGMETVNIVLEAIMAATKFGYGDGFFVVVFVRWVCLILINGHIYLSFKNYYEWAVKHDYP